MATKSALAKIAKLAALLVLLGLSVVIETCSGTTDDNDARREPITYGIGGPAW